MLRIDAAPLVVGILAVAVGVAALMLQWLRRASKDHGLAWFGLLGILYGTRLLLSTRTVAELLDTPGKIRFFIWAITFVIGIPATIFAWSLVSPEWNRTIRILIGVISGLAILAIASYPVTSLRPVMQELNNILVIGFTLAFLAYLFFVCPPTIPQLTLLRIGSGIFGVFVLYTNLVSVNLVPGSAGVEFIGFFIYICLLGYVGAARMFRNEEHLLGHPQGTGDRAPDSGVDSA